MAPKSLQPHVSWLRMGFNFMGCCFAGCILFGALHYSRVPLTLDIIFTIFLAELNRFANEQRRNRLELSNLPGSLEESKVKLEKSGDDAIKNVDSIASIVGYREDRDLFTSALQSYVHARSCRLVLVCIDGDGPEDKDMADVFKEVRQLVNILLASTWTYPSQK
ncbi:hypothetical protein LTR37_005470 [Vermiconidia calcicola]|uniref:Uncharacterized protein n=1 Tax=Vermiconidia calcicola TaxID=1690605 RepID=A0ACC3NJB0_9PEZI|nr:hypothetical protein LTR37_005470 [Vermiconidia calcicola]